jgi:ABC-type multidrug transport system fused ATPase/permease subunit
VEQRTAFSRAWAILDNHQAAKWAAYLSAAVAALLTVALLGVLALFVDLLISQGKVPACHELAGPQRAAFEADVEGFTGPARAEALEAIGVPADRVKAFEAGFEKMPLSGRDQLWRAYVWHLLGSRVGPDAAAAYAAQATSTDPRFDVPGLGVLSLVARTNGLAISPVVGWFASWNTWAWRPDERRTPNFWYLTGLLFLAVVLTILRALLLDVMNSSASTAALAVSTWLRRALYHHTYRLGTLALRANGSGEVTGLFTRHVESVEDAVHALLTSQFFGPVQVAVLLAFALAIHFWLAAAFLLAAVIVLLFGGQLAAGFRRSARAADRRATAHMTLLQESLTMMRLVKSNVMELFNQSRVERQLSEYADARLRRARGEALFRPMLWFLGTVAVAVILYVAGLVILSAGVGTANVIVLAATLVTGYWPIRDWLVHRRTVRRGQESAVLVYEFLDRPREIGQVVGAEFLPGITRQVEFREVSLREPTTGRMLLDKVALQIPAGVRVGLVGSAETEKHAVVYLLARFLDPSAGEVRVDDKNLRWLTLDSLRSQVGLVLQQNLVFNDTVANNIGCGDPSYTIPQIIEAAKIAHAHQFIQKLPYGYETPIGETGSSLRVGERFRIALARAILRDPAMYVIEEPATPLDDDTKNLLDDTFARILPGKTVLFLPHRISTIRSCERLYVIHRGHVEAVGEHRELIARNDLYKHLHYIEFNEFAEQV